MEIKLPKSNKTTFIAGLTLGFLLVGTAAYSFNVDNTPTGGYLLCANKKTKVVTFPNKLSCPSGNTELSMGISGLDGNDGADGMDGSDGAPGTPSKTTPSSLWSTNIQTKDIVITSTSITKSSELRKVVMASINKTNLYGEGNYTLRAHLDGIWAIGAKTNSYISCYFQNSKDFPDGKQLYGTDDTEYQSWSGISLTVFGQTTDSSLSQGDVYLVCATDSNISGLTGYLTALGVVNSKGMSLSPAPSS